MPRRSTCELLLCRRMPISRKARDRKTTGYRQLIIVYPVITGVTTVLRGRPKTKERILKVN